MHYWPWFVVSSNNGHQRTWRLRSEYTPANIDRVGPIIRDEAGKSTPRVSQKLGIRRTPLMCIQDTLQILHGDRCFDFQSRLNYAVPVRELARWENFFHKFFKSDVTHYNSMGLQLARYQTLANPWSIHQDEMLPS